MSAAEWIAKRRELLAAATEGPWEADGSYIDSTATWSRVALGVRQNAIADDPDAELIADARTSLPLALDALEAAQGLAKRHRDFVTKRGRDDCICTICDMCRAIETALMHEYGAALRG